MEENKYIEGFNDGFLIATHRPEAAQDLVKSYQESPMPYLEGLKDGIEERQLEQERGRLDELGALRENKLDKNVDRDR
jgi:hypothetical protein